MSRRASLGPISQSTLNSRQSTVGPSRVSGAGDGVPMKPSRMSLAPGMLGPPVSRPSLGATLTGSSRRASVGVSRKSSLQPRSSSLVPSGVRVADPRNISDKQFMNNGIRLLIQYLTEHNYDHVLSPKILTRPSNKDFNNIVVFLFRQLDPNLTIVGKFEDDVVALFKQLAYPCQISKANIGAAGTPHAWPSLLACLVWLVELLMYDEAAAIGEYRPEDEEAAAFDGSDSRESEKAFQNFLYNSYALFLAAEDDRCAELEEQFIGSFDAKNLLLQDQIHAIEQRNIGIANEIEAVENRRAYLPELEARKKDYQKDLGKFMKLIDELMKHKDQMQSKTQLREAELEKLTTTLGTVQGEINVLKEKISTQELSPEDVKRMITEREQLEQSQQQASEFRQGMQRKLWELEMALRDRVQALDDSARSYNIIAEDLKLVPHTARNARGKQLAIEVDVRAKKRDDLLRTDVHADILPTLNALKLELNENTTSLRSEVIAEQDNIDEIESSLQELEEHTSLSEAKQKRMEDAYRREKDALDQALALHSQEMDALETKLVRLRDISAEESRITACIRKIEELKSIRDSRANQHAQRKVETMEAIMDVVTMCAAHRETVQTRLGDLKDKFTDKLEGHLMGGSQAGVSDDIRMPQTPNQFASSLGFNPRSASAAVRSVPASPYHSSTPMSSSRRRSPFNMRLLSEADAEPEPASTAVFSSSSSASSSSSYLNRPFSAAPSTATTTTHPTTYSSTKARPLSASKLGSATRVQAWAQPEERHSWDDVRQSVTETSSLAYGDDLNDLNDSTVSGADFGSMAEDELGTNISAIIPDPDPTRVAYPGKRSGAISAAVQSSLARSQPSQYYNILETYAVDSSRLSEQDDNDSYMQI